jgi:signal recognition particle receptor subunit beta
VLTLPFSTSLCPQQKGKIKPVDVVDVPGHSRLRPKLDDFLPQAAGIVFVVDALEFLPNLSAVTE